jgi:hypothetical protein
VKTMNLALGKMPNERAAMAGAFVQQFLGR